MEEILKRFNFQGTWEQLSSLVEKYNCHLSKVASGGSKVIPMSVTSDWPKVKGRNEPIYAALEENGHYKLLPYWSKEIEGHMLFEKLREKFSREFGKSKQK